EQEAAILCRVELQHRPRIHPALRRFVDLHVYVILRITHVVHVVDDVAVLIIHLDDHHPTAVLIALGVVVALVVVVLRDDRRAAVIALVVLCPCSWREPSSQDQRHSGAERQEYIPLHFRPPFLVGPSIVPWLVPRIA